MGAVSAYDFDGLGWLLFERLATDAVERELAVPASAWEGSADAIREAVCDHGVPAAGVSQAAVSRMVWVRATSDVATRLGGAAAGDTGRRSLVLVVNVDEETVPDGLAARVLDRRWLSAALERSGELRLVDPSAMGLRAGGPCVAHRAPSGGRPLRAASDAVVRHRSGGSARARFRSGARPRPGARRIARALLHRAD